MKCFRSSLRHFGGNGTEESLQEGPEEGPVPPQFTIGPPSGPCFKTPCSDATATVTGRTRLITNRTKAIYTNAGSS